MYYAFFESEAAALAYFIAWMAMREGSKLSEIEPVERGSLYPYQRAADFDTDYEFVGHQHQAGTPLAGAVATAGDEKLAVAWPVDDGRAGNEAKLAAILERFAELGIII